MSAQDGLQGAIIFNLRIENNDLRAEVERLTALVQCLLDNDPDDLAADGGVTVLMVWRKEAQRALGAKQANRPVTLPKIGGDK